MIPGMTAGGGQSYSQTTTGGNQQNEWGDFNIAPVNFGTANGKTGIIVAGAVGVSLLILGAVWIMKRK